MLISFNYYQYTTMKFRIIWAQQMIDTIDFLVKKIPRFLFQKKHFMKMNQKLFTTKLRDNFFNGTHKLLIHQKFRSLFIYTEEAKNCKFKERKWKEKANAPNGCTRRDKAIIGYDWHMLQWIVQMLCVCFFFLVKEFSLNLLLSPLTPTGYCQKLLLLPCRVVWQLCVQSWARVEVLKESPSVRKTTILEKATRHIWKS